MDVRIGLWRKLSTGELMLLNCGVGEDSWESLGLQGDPTSPSEGDQPWDFFGRNDAKAETPVLWPPHGKSWLIGKDSDAGRDWGQEEKGTTEDEMAGWHHWLNGRESEWTLGVVDGQGGLVCCDSWSCKESDMTARQNWTELNWGKLNEEPVGVGDKVCQAVVSPLVSSLVMTVNLLWLMKLWQLSIWGGRWGEGSVFRQKGSSKKPLPVSPVFISFFKIFIY